MDTISSDQLKQKGISVIESSMNDCQEVPLTVNGSEKYVVMTMERYNFLRECELDVALIESKEKQNVE
ncbi:MAG: type II toxin-antitoxin system Phd/YefM family antitoxin [Planctomycetota bacterium]|jgi:hypothetical protein